MEEVHVEFGNRRTAGSYRRELVWVWLLADRIGWTRSRRWERAPRASWHLFDLTLLHPSTSRVTEVFRSRCPARAVKHDRLLFYVQNFVFGKTCSYRQMRVARCVISLALPCYYSTNKTSWILRVLPLLLVASFSLKFGWNGQAKG